MTAPLHSRDLHSGRVVGAKLEGDELRVLLLGRDLDHRVQRLSGLDVGEAPPGGDLPQAVHVGGGDQQVAGEETPGERSPLSLYKSPRSRPDLWLRRNHRNTLNSPGEHVTRLLHLVTRNVMLHVGFVDPSLDVDDLLPVVVRHGRAVDLV